MKLCGGGLDWQNRNEIAGAGRIAGAAEREPVIAQVVGC
jgi:hypothetical protein